MQKTFFKAVYPFEKKKQKKKKKSQKKKKKNRHLISAKHDKCITWQNANENKKEDWLFAQLLEDHSRQNLAWTLGEKIMHCLAE